MSEVPRKLCPHCDGEGTVGTEDTDPAILAALPNREAAPREGLDVERLARATVNLDLGPDSAVFPSDRAAARYLAAEYASLGAEPRVTHGRHCPCSACGRQDWADPNLAACGMHGPSCPAVYAPIRAALGR